MAPSRESSERRRSAAGWLSAALPASEGRYGRAFRSLLVTQFRGSPFPTFLPCLPSAFDSIGVLFFTFAWRKGFGSFACGFSHYPECGFGYVRTEFGGLLRFHLPAKNLAFTHGTST